MTIRRFSQNLDNYSDPRRPLFFPAQLLFVSGLAYAGVAVVNLTRIISTTPLHGMVYVLLVVGIHKLTAPFFSDCFKPITKDSLRPKAYKFVKWSFSLLSAKLICALFGISITLTQIIWIGIAFFVALRIAKLVVTKLRKSTNAPTLSEIPLKKPRV